MASITFWLVSISEPTADYADANELKLHTEKTKNPTCLHMPGISFWRRPTLAQPIAVLPSGLQRLTAVFGMGTGGATALVSPEIYPESFRGKFLVRDPRFETRGSESFRRITIHDSRISIHQRFTVHSVKERQFSDIYIRGRDSRFVTPLQRTLSSESRFTI